MSRVLGIDLEALGCNLREAQYKAALLDDTRWSFQLRDLAQDFLGDNKQDIDRKRIWELPAYVAGPYAEHDGYLHLALDTELTKRCDAEGLTDVYNLEDDLIYATCEMEYNGARLDVPKLESWHHAIQKLQRETIVSIYQATGLKINPNSAKDMERLFKFLDLPYDETATGLGSFTSAFLRTVDNKLVQMARLARGLASLDSKYFAKYLRSVDKHGIIRYKLHQLKGDDYGTISGRYSSSGYSRDKGLNIQQVFDPERQAKNMPDTADYLVRDLFIPDDGFVFGKADASQIEFRFFGEYSKSRRIIDAYKENPWVDFHVIVANLLRQDRKRGKGLNFGMIYCMGREKLARELGLPLEESNLLYDAYNEMFPEVRPLIHRAIEAAKNRGYVFTRLGRRARFPTQERLHSALNRVIQGTAADYMKLKIREVYRNRKTLGIHKLRWTVHDELDADFESAEHVYGPFAELLNEQLFDTQIPILWEAEAGPSWGSLKKRTDNKQEVDTRSPNRWKSA